MTEKTRIGMVLAMIFIVGFAVLLTEFRKPDEPADSERVVSIDNGYTSPSLPSATRHPHPSVRTPVRREVARDVIVRPVERTAHAPARRTARRQSPPMRLDATIRRLPDTDTPPAYREETVDQFGRRMANVDRQQHNTPPAQQHKYYTVRRGDNLRKIARKTLSDDRKWKNIYKANRDQLRDPDTLEIGMTLKIPG